MPQVIGRGPGSFLGRILGERDGGQGKGQGEGEGAGFSAGTSRGKVRFIRLKYDGGDWHQDMERGSDLNLLTEYGVRTGHRVNDRPEPMDIRRLKSFPARKSPPMVYMTGQRGIQVGDSDLKILRSYLLDKHGDQFFGGGFLQKRYERFHPCEGEARPSLQGKSF